MQSSVAEKQTEANQMNYTPDGEGQRRERNYYRADNADGSVYRGSRGRPMYRGSRPYDPERGRGRGRGRGAYRGNFNQGPNGEMGGESSDAAYSQRPNRGYSRGSYQPRGDRGRRGGYYPAQAHWESAQPQTRDLGDDVIELVLNDQQLAIYE